MKSPTFRGSVTQTKFPTSARKAPAQPRPQSLIAQTPDDEQPVSDVAAEGKRVLTTEPDMQQPWVSNALLQPVQDNWPYDVFSDAGAGATLTSVMSSSKATEPITAITQALANTAGTTNTIDSWLTRGFAAASLGLVVASTVKTSNTSPPVFSFEKPGKAVSVAENTAASTMVYTAQATDNVAVTGYALAGGADDGKFNLNTSTGELTFKTSPDFEAPGSAASSNTYTVKVKAIDAAGNSAIQTITVNVTDVDDTAPTLSIAPSNPTQTPDVLQGPISLSLQLSEPVPGFDASHLQVGGASVLSFSADSATHYTLLLQPSANTQGQLTVDVLRTGLQDAAGNPLANVPTYSYNYNTINTVIQGTVQAGPLLPGHQLSVNIFDDQGRVLVSGVQINSQGHFEVALGDYSGVVWCLVQNANGGSDYLDEATGKPKDLSSPLLAAAVVNTAGNAIVINVNPLTTLAALEAGAQMSTQSAGQFILTSAATEQRVSEANQAVANAFGLSDITKANVQTTVLADGSSNPQANAYGQVLAALSGMDQVNGGTSATLSLLQTGLSVQDGQAQLSETLKVHIMEGALTVGVQEVMSLLISLPLKVDDTAPVFTDGAGKAVSVAENTAASTVVLDVNASDNGAAADAGITYSKSGADAALFTLDATTGELYFISSPNFEAPIDNGADNVYNLTITASDAAHNISTQDVAVTVTNQATPTSAQAFALWQTAETNTAAGDVNALNAYSQEIVQEHDNTGRDGSANQVDATKRLTQYIDQVTGTDIVSDAEYKAGFTITGHTTAYAQGTLKFWLDNDRTNGVNEMGVQLQDGMNGVHINYNNSSGDYSIVFDSNSRAIKPATHDTYGSGIHQLTVDTDGNGTKNGVGTALEASRLFLVADGTANNSDAGAVAQNYSVQDTITNDVFVYYYGDPDGAGVGLWTALDNGDSASNPFAVNLDRNNSDGLGDWDYYNSAGSATGTQATANNTALHFVTDIAAQTWEFHIASYKAWKPWSEANALAIDHTIFGSNTSRQASLAEAVALYAANFGADNADGKTVGAVQPMSNVLNTINAAENNTPGGWNYYLWTAAPTPSGHALVALDHATVGDNPNAYNPYYYVYHMVSAVL